MTPFPLIALVEYKLIAGFPGYRVGNDGSVWTRLSNSGRLREHWKRRKLTRRKSGHLFVGLVHEGEMRMVGVHTLVLESFVGTRPDGLQCRHLDGNPANNRISNLCWGTPKENSADSKRHGTWVHGEQHPSAKLTVSDIVTIRSLAAKGTTVSAIAKKYGVRRFTISLAVAGKTWAHVTALRSSKGGGTRSLFDSPDGAA